ncbi:MAG: hypothetical protein AAF865_14985 [Pseudomonadota bacterium]
MAEGPAPTLMVVIDLDTKGGPGVVLDRLVEAGFVTVDVFETFGIVIGRFDGDPAALLRLPGVQTVREEGSFTLSPPKPDSD